MVLRCSIGVFRVMESAGPDSTQGSNETVSLASHTSVTRERPESVPEIPNLRTASQVLHREQYPHGQGQNAMLLFRYGHRIVSSLVYINRATRYE
jgi:hypothetical protein